MIEKVKEYPGLRETKKSEQTRNAILVSAACQFRDRGYAATTLRDIAAAANVKAGSIYYHFGSKIEILDEVLDCGLRDIHNSVHKAIKNLNADAEYRQIITIAIHAHLSSLLLHSEFTSANIRIYSQLPHEVRIRHQPSRRAYAKVWDKMLEKAQKAGVLRADIRIKPLRRFVLGALNWTVEWYDGKNYSVTVLADRAAKVVLDGILIEPLSSKSKSHVPSKPVQVVAEMAPNKSDRTRQNILIAAARLFQKQGYASTTLRNIATAAEMQAGSIYYYFDTKSEIMDAVLDRGLRDIHHSVNNIIQSYKVGGDYRTKFMATVYEHLSQLLVCGEFTSANLRTYGQLPQEMRKRHEPLRNAYSELWDGLLGEAKVDGKLREDLNIIPLRQFILGALNWTVEWFDAEQYSVDMLSERCGILLLDGICAKPN